MAAVRDGVSVSESWRTSLIAILPLGTLDISEHHLLDEFIKGDGPLPSEDFLSLGGVSVKELYFSGTLQVFQV